MTLIGRRKVLRTMGAAAMACTFAVRSQSTKVPHLAYLSTGTPESNGALLDALKESLRELGYVEGKNIVIDVGWVGPYANRFPQLAASGRRRPVILLAVGLAFDAVLMFSPRALGRKHVRRCRRHRRKALIVIHRLRAAAGCDVEADRSVPLPDTHH